MDIFLGRRYALNGNSRSNHNIKISAAASVVPNHCGSRLVHTTMGDSEANSMIAGDSFLAAFFVITSANTCHVPLHEIDNGVLSRIDKGRSVFTPNSIFRVEIGIAQQIITTANGTHCLPRRPISSDVPSQGNQAIISPDTVQAVYYHSHHVGWCLQ